LRAVVTDDSRWAETVDGQPVSSFATSSLRRRPAVPLAALLLVLFVGAADRDHGQLAGVRRDPASAAVVDWLRNC
jgi:hypothetical protein